MLKGNQEARYLITPHCEDATEEVGESIIDWGIEHRYFLDPWQEAAILAWTRVRPAGQWCAKTWVASAARQNGKNGGLELFEAYAMAVLGLAINHTAHRLKTARSSFRRLQRFFGRTANDPNAPFPELNAMVAEFRHANGQEEILLHNNGRIVVGTRGSGSGRGETFDVLVVDEAQEYETDEQEALEPTISAAPGGDPVIIYLGTPPRSIGERGEPFVRVRTDAITGKSKKTAYVEHSAAGQVDKMTDLELEAFVRDRKNWQDGNPALNIRIHEETIEGELERMSPRSFARERLNMWPSPADLDLRAIKPEAWQERELSDPDPDWPLAAIGVDMNPERTKVTIAMAVFAPHGVHIEIAADAPFSEEGTTALAEWLWERAKRRVPVVVDAYSPVRSIEPFLRRKKMKLFVLSAAEYGQACMGLADAVSEGTVSHFGQSQLTLSAQGAMKEPMGKAGAWKFARASLDVDLSLVVAAACAWLGAIKFAKRPAGGGSPTGGGGVSVKPMHGIFI